MTAQINDTVFHRKIDYSLAGISGEGLFDPEQHDFKLSRTFCSACWRGYVADYSILDGQLLLTGLRIVPGAKYKSEAWLEESQREFLGMKPQKKTSLFWVYGPLQVPVPFTGGLLLADGFISELYVHMGFHPAWKYERVREVVLDKGVVVEDEDHSAEMIELRSKITAKDLPPHSLDKKEIGDWVERCFSRNYTKTW